LALPARAVSALRSHRERQRAARDRAADRWQEAGLVFTSRVGTELLAGNVRRTFRLAIAAAGLNPKEWTPRELRHSSVSLMSDSGVRIEDIAELCGHAGTRVTEDVYRHQLRPVILNGAVAMDRIFAPDGVVDMRLDTQASKMAISIGWTWPLSWWAILGLNQ